MLKVEYSPRAEDDLVEIALYTLQNWGEAQAHKYVRELERLCRLLGDFAELGRPCHHIAPGLRRMEHGRHVVFYRIDPDRILISRVKHEEWMVEAEDFEG